MNITMPIGFGRKRAVKGDVIAFPGGASVASADEERLAQEAQAGMDAVTADVTRLNELLPMISGLNVAAIPEMAGALDRVEGAIIEILNAIDEYNDFLTQFRKSARRRLSRKSVGTDMIAQDIATVQTVLVRLTGLRTAEWAGVAELVATALDEVSGLLDTLRSDGRG